MFVVNKYTELNAAEKLRSPLINFTFCTILHHFLFPNSFSNFHFPSSNLCIFFASIGIGINVFVKLSLLLLAYQGESCYYKPF